MKLEMESALALLLEHAPCPAAAERVPLLQACGRICSEDIDAAIDQPPFDRSPLDGFGLRAEDIAAASRSNGVELEIAMDIHAGDGVDAALQPGCAAKLTTGSMLPEGVDCVVPQEDTLVEGRRVRIYANPGKGANLVRRGEDLKRGQRILELGQALDSAHIGVLAGQGFLDAPVYARPKIGLLSTGDELTTAGVPLAAGKIYDSNSLMLAARVSQLGAVPVMQESVGDDLTKLHTAIKGLLDGCDMVVTTGGASVGDRDYMPELGRLLGADMLFRRLNYKPGGNTLGWLAGSKDADSQPKLLLCLSGNPFAAVASFELLAAPVIRKMCGVREHGHIRREATMADGFNKASKRRRFVRAFYDGGRVTLPGLHSSGCLSTLPGCNCLLDIPAGSPELSPGDRVSALLFQHGG